MFKASIFTLYPDFFPGPLGQSLSGDALNKGLWSLTTHNIRDHGLGRHKAVDDTPAGGGVGMVIRADVLAARPRRPRRSRVAGRRALLVLVHAGRDPGVLGPVRPLATTVPM